MTDVIRFPVVDGAAGELHEALFRVLDDYAGRVSVAAALGVLELVKAQLIADQQAVVFDD